MMEMSLPGLPLSTNDSYELVLTSPYMVAELEAPNPLTPNDPNPSTFLVLHRATKTCACEHFNYKAAKLCADGIRCTKSRNKVTTKQ